MGGGDGALSGGGDGAEEFAGGGGGGGWGGDKSKQFRKNSVDGEKKQVYEGVIFYWNNKEKYMSKLSTTVGRILETAAKTGAWIYNDESLKFVLANALKGCAGVGNVVFARSAKEIGAAAEEGRAIDVALVGDGVRPYVIAVSYEQGTKAVVAEGPKEEDIAFVKSLADAGFEGGCVVRVVELTDGTAVSNGKRQGKGWKSVELREGTTSRAGLYRADAVADGWFTGELPAPRGERCRCTKRYSCPLAKAGKCFGADTDLLTPVADGEGKATVSGVDNYLMAELEKFREAGRSSVLLRAGDVHDWLGIQPARHATVCYALNNIRGRLKSEIVREPKKHLGSNLCLRFFL